MKKTLLIISILLFAVFTLNTVNAQTFSPANGATDVSVSPVLSITFDDDVEFVYGGSIFIFDLTYDILLTLETGKIEARPAPLPPKITPPDSRLIVSEDKKTLTIDLSSTNLLNNNEISVMISENSLKVGGNYWNELYTSTWSFTTEESSPSLSVVSFSPANNSTDIPLTGNTFTVEFDNDITLATENKNFRVKRKSDSVTVQTIDVSQPYVSVVKNNKLVVNISYYPFDADTEFYITIEDGFVLGYSGFSTNTTWTFKTEGAPPTWSSGFPTVEQKASGFDFKAKGNVDGFVYYVITTSFNPPTIINILEGKNEFGNEVMSATYPIEKDVVLNSEFINYASLNGDPYYWFHMVMTDSEKSKFSKVATLTIDRTSPTLGEGTRPVVGCTNFPVDGSIMLHFSKMIYNYNAETESLSTLTASSFSLKNGEISVPFTFSTDGAYVYMTPENPLEEDTEYSIVVNNASDSFFNFIDGTLRTLKTVKINRWIGSKDRNWADAANWDGAYVSGKNVIILAGKDYYPIVNSNIEVNDLTIEAGALLEHSSGTITVNGDLELLSSETTNATYMPLGGTLVVEGETRVYQSIKYQGDNDYRYLLGAPTSGANNYNIESGYMVRRYNNTTDSWTWIENDYFQPGVGYLVFADNDLVFPGAINSGDISVAITRTNGKGFGWNMLANPYTSGIDWLKVVDEELVENSYWIWIPSQRGYSSYNGAAELGTNGLTNEIPSNHGFAVKVLQEKTNGTFTFSPEAMVVNSSNFLKSSSKKSVDHIKLSLSGNNNTNQLAVAFIESATQGVDKYDTEILLGNDSSIEIYTLAGNEKLVINSLPKIDSEQDVSLGFRVLKTGSYKVAIDKNNTSFDNVQLTDLVEGNVVNLLEEDYVFNVNKAGTLINDRFQLTFPSSGVGTRLNSVSENSSIQVFVKDSQLNVLVNEIEECDYRLVDISGRIIRRGTLYNGENSIDNLSKGAFIINIITSDGLIFVKKLFIIE